MSKRRGPRAYRKWALDTREYLGGIIASVVPRVHAGLRCYVHLGGGHAKDFVS